MNGLQPPRELLGVLEQLESREPRPRRLLLQAIETWDRLIGEIGHYPGGLSYEYLNDLGDRTHVSLWLSMAAEEEMNELLEWVLPIVDEIDNRYLAKSRPDDEGLNWNPSRLNPHYWWLRRLPEDEALLQHFRTVGPNMRKVTTDARASED